MRFLKSAWSSLCAVTLASFATSASADIIIQGYTDATNDRFSNNAAFVAAAYNLSGVGQNASGGAPTGRWATAISRNVIISANHLDAGAGNIAFFPGNDPSASPVLRTVESAVQIPNTDLWLGRLNSFLPDNIAHYNIHTEPLTGPDPVPPAIGSLVSAGSLQGRNAFMFGRSPFNEDANPNDNRFAWNDAAVGRNLISGYIENANVPSLGQTDLDSLILIFDSAPPNQVPFEAMAQSGDSGAPLLVDINGNLVLLGINSFIFSGGVSGTGVSYVGNQATFINNFISNAIPEPASGLLVLAGVAGLAVVRRRTAA